MASSLSRSQCAPQDLALMTDGQRVHHVDLARNLVWGQLRTHEGAELVR